MIFWERGMRELVSERLIIWGGRSFCFAKTKRRRGCREAGAPHASEGRGDSPFFFYGAWSTVVLPCLYASYSLYVV